jgi:calcium permeable stress-gated cation channel
MSVISKNFFFTFFNLFVVFTAFGTVSNYKQAQDELGKQLKDLPLLANTLAGSLAKLSQFYMNLIVLQAFGLFPVRLLEFGTVALYPLGLIGAKTPRGKE